MSGFKNQIIQALSYSSKVNSANAYSPNSVYSSNEDNKNFSNVLDQLNKNIDKALLTNNMNLYGYNNYSFNPINSNQTVITPNINAITQKIQDDTSDTVDIDSKVKEYLLENYGGSELGVIMNLSGTQNLPIQAITMQDQIFNNIATKIAFQVRENLYSSQQSSNYSLFYSDDSTDNDSSDSDFSI